MDVIFEDDDILVVDKPAGMIVHPAPGHPAGTLVNALLAYRPSIAGVGSVERPGIVHRLDQDTSGVMVVAKTDRAYRRLREMFESHEGMAKTYLAVLHGSPNPRKGTLDTLIGRKSWDAKRMAVVNHGDGLWSPHSFSGRTVGFPGDSPRRLCDIYELCDIFICFDDLRLPWGQSPRFPSAPPRWRDCPVGGGSAGRLAPPRGRDGA